MIGIIAAEEIEMQVIKDLTKNIEIIEIFNLEFIKGKINDKDIVLVKSGEGKVNAARTTQIMIDNFEIDFVINVGSAGAVNPELNVQDIVIADRLIQYDFDISPLGYEKAEICGIGKYLECDKGLVEKLKNTIEQLEKDNKIVIGLIGTADSFCSGSEMAKSIRDEFNVECIEMEGAAIAQVCILDRVPFVVIRGISDTANGNNHIDFRTYLDVASKQVARIIDKFLE